MILKHLASFFYIILKPNRTPNHRYLRFGYRKPKPQFFCGITATTPHIKKRRYLRGVIATNASLDVGSTDRLLNYLWYGSGDGRLRSFFAGYVIRPVWLKLGLRSSALRKAPKYFVVVLEKGRHCCPNSWGISWRSVFIKCTKLYGDWWCWIWN